VFIYVASLKQSLGHMDLLQCPLYLFCPSLRKLEIYVNCPVVEIPDIICYGNKTPFSRPCNADFGFRNLESEADFRMKGKKWHFFTVFHSSHFTSVQPTKSLINWRSTFNEASFNSPSDLTGYQDFLSQRYKVHL
jgi:hypothetical protein